MDGKYPQWVKTGCVGVFLGMVATAALSVALGFALGPQWGFGLFGLATLAWALLTLRVARKERNGDDNQ